MRREQFMKGVEKYHLAVVKSLTVRGIEPSVAEDVTQDTVVTLLANNTYRRVKGEAINSGLCAYLKKAAKNSLRNLMRRQTQESDTFVSVESERETVRSREQHANLKRERIKYEEECPFCHDSLLRTHQETWCTSKVCPLCHTILGQGKSMRKHISIEESDLASMPDFDTRLDVAKAVASLLPIEQLVVNAIAQGTDTLDGIACMQEYGRDDLWRIYVRAKKKLQVLLAEYAPQSVS